MAYRRRTAFVVIFHTLAALSVLLLLADTWMWVRSSQVRDGQIGDDGALNRRDATHRWSMQSRMGRIVVFRRSGDSGGAKASQIRPFYFPGFAREGFAGPNGSRLFYTTSHCAVGLLASAMPPLWLATALGRRYLRIRGFAVEPARDQVRESNSC